jgi:hypothetical protein
VIRRAPPSRYLLAALVALAVVGFAVVRAIDAFHSASTALSQAGSDTRSGGDRADSLFRARNVESALEALRDKTGGEPRVIELRIEPRRMRWQVQSGADSARGWDWDGDTMRRFDVSRIGAGRVAENVFPLERVRGATVERLAKGAARRFDGTLDDVRAMRLELDLSSREPEWTIFMLRGERGQLYLADADGRRLRRPGQ